MPRANYLVRCVRCRMHLARCICPHIPHLDIATRLVIVAHHREASKVSNTTYYARLALSNSEQQQRGGLDDPPVAVPGDRPALLLFPYDEARVLTPAMARPGGVTLVVPDGTWAQARRMAKREASLRELPRVCLPPGPLSLYRLRRQHRADGLCTFEAIARALGVLEGALVENQLMAFFAHVVDSMGRDPVEDRNRAEKTVF